MSRTFRRKNIENEKPNLTGSKLHGIHTVEDYGPKDNKPPTFRERFKLWFQAHGDHGDTSKHKGDEGMSPWKRKTVEHQHRQEMAKKIKDVIKGKTDDVIPEKLKKSPSWFW